MSDGDIRVSKKRPPAFVSSATYPQFNKKQHTQSPETKTPPMSTHKASTSRPQQAEAPPAKSAAQRIERDTNPDLPNNAKPVDVREKVAKFRESVAPTVSIPDTWHGETKLDEWIDWTSVDRALRPTGLLAARSSLIDDQRPRPSTSLVRSDRSCSSLGVDVMS